MEKRSKELATATDPDTAGSRWLALRNRYPALVLQKIAIEVIDVVKPRHVMVVLNEGMQISKEPGKQRFLRIKFDVMFPSRLSTYQKHELKKIMRKGYKLS
ncbi:hypothetical protein S83_028928 [Arachis hypogaea]